MTMTTKMKPVSQGGVSAPSVDDPKSDIADIMVRFITHPEQEKAIAKAMNETEAEKACRLLGLQEIHEGVVTLIDKLDLTID